MKLKYIFITAALLNMFCASAQDIYTMESVTSEDLNGTARFIGMGGAMSALGADISTMGTNPAGIGLYRSADVATSLSLNALAEGQKFDEHGKTRMSYDQAGIVYPIKMGNGSMRFFNVGFNYHKRKNFKSLISADQNLTNGASQTWEMADVSSFFGDASVNDGGTPLTDAGYQTYLFDKVKDEHGKDVTDEFGNKVYNVYNGVNNSYRKWTTGGIQQYDFNMSTNISDRYYFGITMGVYNVDIDSYSGYMENLADNDGLPVGSYTSTNARSLSGNGLDVKFGTIIYPIEGYSFRVGVSFSTPVWYSLTENCTSQINSKFLTSGDGESASVQYDKYDLRTEIGDHDYNIRTPWKFNISAGGTIGDFLALDAEYEYSDYSSAKLSYDEGYDEWSWSGSETKDRELNREASKYLKGVSTVRLGAEAKLDYGLSLRLGYNYVSTPIKSNALQNQFINSASIDYNTSTNYVNLGDINRYTVGLGYKAKHFYTDFAWQYQQQSGDFYAFTTQRGNPSETNEAPCTKLKLDRSQFLLTLGYKF